MTKLSIIIVNYKGRAHLEACLGAIYERPPACSFEVIVVDNASDDGSIEFIKAGFPDVVLISNKFNYGFATANNQGFDVSSGEYVMTLNPDAEIAGDCMGRAVSTLDENQDIGILAPCLLEESGIFAVYDGYPIIPRFRTLGRLGIGPSNAYCPVPDGLKRVSWIWGTGYISRRAALGGRFFDDSTFLFAEEQEICTRVKDNGFSIAVSSEFLLKHIGSVTYGRDKEKSALARRLLEAACWKHRRDRLGLMLANLHQFLRGVDDFLMLMILRAKDLVAEKSPGRELEMANLRANVTASVFLIFMGNSYFQRVNREARVYFNNGIDIPFPPQTNES